MMLTSVLKLFVLLALVATASLVGGVFLALLVIPG
jgi:hypothetical protein